MHAKQKAFFAKAKSWIAKNNLHGKHAFLRYIMMEFVERLNQQSNEFIFKGGNLLWLYIGTPRSTTDLDFVTAGVSEHDTVERLLRSVCEGKNDDVQFSVKSFARIDRPDGRGADVTIVYETKQGQKNSFDIDIVYAVHTRDCKIPSPISESTQIRAVTIENIICDKLAASHKYRSGNTRMKDYDDLFRISRSANLTIDWQTLSNLMNERGVTAELELKWINPSLEIAWNSHLLANEGLPERLSQLFRDVNSWLKAGLRI